MYCHLLFQSELWLVSTIAHEKDIAYSDFIDICRNHDELQPTSSKPSLFVIVTSDRNSSSSFKDYFFYLLLTTERNSKSNSWWNGSRILSEHQSKSSKSWRTTTKTSNKSLLFVAEPSAFPCPELYSWIILLPYAFLLLEKTDSSKII